MRYAIAAILMLFAIVPPAPAAERAADGAVTRATLDSGLRVISVRHTLAPVASLAAARRLVRRVDRSQGFKPRPLPGPRLCILNDTAIDNDPARSYVHCEPHRDADPGVALMLPAARRPAC